MLRSLVALAPVILAQVQLKGTLVVEQEQYRVSRYTKIVGTQVIMTASYMSIVIGDKVMFLKQSFVSCINMQQEIFCRNGSLLIRRTKQKEWLFRKNLVRTV